MAFIETMINVFNSTKKRYQIENSGQAENTHKTEKEGKKIIRLYKPVL